jgi:hypothetical protein
MLGSFFWKAFSVVYAMGKVTVFCAGLVVVVGLSFGVASVAEAKVPSLHLGVSNTVHALTSIVGNLSTAILHIDNTGAGSGVDIKVASGNAPLTVNSDAGKATNLDADKLDGKDSTEFASSTIEAWHEVGSSGEPQFTGSASCPQPDGTTRTCTWGNADTTTTHNSAAFFKDSSGIVHLKGYVTAPNCGALQNNCMGLNASVLPQIYILPVGYRPAKEEVQATISDSGLSRLDITPDGRVIPVLGRSSNFSLDGITARAAGS